MDSIYSALVPTANDTDREIIASVLADMPTGVLSTLAAANCTVRPLAKRERYASASPALRRLGIDVDGWPSPPAGLFVVEERTVYLRSRSRMTICHETMHALDCALGSGVYRSGADPEIRAAYTGARRFVTPYAATGTDEYFAESARAFIGGCNDPSSSWPDATPERLRACDPATYDLMAKIFAEIARAAVPTQMELVLRS